VQFQDYVILLLAGACLGPLSGMKDTNLGVTGYFYTLIALGKRTYAATAKIHVFGGYGFFLACLTEIWMCVEQLF
jgi:hypothetical protein